MADHEEWFVNEDGCISVGYPSEAVSYHPTLNAILVTTKEPASVRVLDVTSGLLLQTSHLSANENDKIKVSHIPGKDHVLFNGCHAVGMRKDLNGILLLDTALQTRVQKSDDLVTVELPLPEASHLFKALMKAELSGVDYVDDVLKVLETEIERVQHAAKQNHKVAKWACVSLKLPHCALKTVCGSLVLELRLQKNVPGLSVASAISDRLSYLLPGSGAESSGGQVDRTLMYSEAARRETFSKWPHMNYKWALPDPMAQAGFYHQPSSSGDDRAMCFTCNVCLVCWEPTDEPWSEHERHSPNCPFVKGEYTQNVPMSVTCATQPAQSHGSPEDQIRCMSTTSSDEFFATSGLHGDVVVWSMNKVLQRHSEFNIDPWEHVIAGTMGCWSAEAKEEPPGASPEPGPSSEDDHEASSDDPPDPSSLGGMPLCESPTPTSSLPNGIMDESEGKVEIIELGGAWKKSSSSKMVDVPLTSAEPIRESFQRCRPSQDVLVSSMCVLGAPRSSKGEVFTSRASLVSGVTIRRSAVPSEGSEESDVQAMNEVNQAMSSGENAPQIIAERQSATPTSSEGSRFVPYIVVHDIGHRPQQQRPAKAVAKVTEEESTGDKVPDVYIPMDMEDPDADVQIIGFTPPPTEPNKYGFQVQKIPPLVTKHPVISAPSSSKEAPARDSRATKPCKAIQCLPLPAVAGQDQHVSHIAPTPDGSHVVVVTEHRSHDADLNALCGVSEDGGHCGCLLLYKTAPEFGLTTLEVKPAAVRVLEDPGERVLAVSLLPLEVTHAMFDEDDEDSDDAVSAPRPHMPGQGAEGQMVLATQSGKVKVVDLCNLVTRATIMPPGEEKFVSACYCSGIDRLCCLSEEGKLHFYMIGPQAWHADELDFARSSITSAAASSAGSGAKSSASAEDVPDSGVPADGLPKYEDLLVHQPLNTKVLSSLYDLTRFENLVPRFSATVPPCWSEIQQEQQQRRHPQHLHQQGEATQHTRSWRLQPDSTSWDEHLFELVLPRPCCVGHVDLKFSLHPLCAVPPNIEVTLLKQSVSSIGRVMSPSGGEYMEDKSADGDMGASCQSDEAKASGINSISPEFLEQNGAKIICGPVDLLNFIDMSGDSGVVTLTSPQLLKVKSKSFLVHLKAVLTAPAQKPASSKKEKKPSSSKDSSKSSSTKTSTSAAAAGSTLPHFLPQASSTSADAAAASKQKLENVRGCDWIQEISITVRRSCKSAIPQDRLQRYAMLESSQFHWQLVQIACGSKEDGASSGAPGGDEYRQRLALAILTWILAIHVNTLKQGNVEDGNILLTVQANLKSLVKSCFFEAGRSIAHQCSKMFSLCIEYTKNFSDATVVPAFNFSLLQALLDCLPLVGGACSAGALRWYFLLLNRVKCLDPGATSEKCAEVLKQVAEHYNQRSSHQHALLKARYGLYGSPLDPDLFDMDPFLSGKSCPDHHPPANLTSNCACFDSDCPHMTGMTYASAAAAEKTPSSSGGPADHRDFSDILRVVSAEKGKTCVEDVSRHLMGLLEVEPLHFTCYATSDGTRMERLSSAVASINALSSLSSAMSLAESNLSMMQNMAAASSASDGKMTYSQSKQLQLLKLLKQQQKLEQKLAAAESAKGVTGPPLVYYGGGGELMPPTPKNTPFFMTPPVTPPNETYQNIYIGTGGLDPGKPPSGKESAKAMDGDSTDNKKLPVNWPQMHSLFHPPPAQALVIERMHAGAKRFVVLDFGQPVMLTDMVIPACPDLASISVDIWVAGEEIDGQRLALSSDIGLHSLILSDILPPTVCQYLKITTIGKYSGSTSRSKIPIGSFFGHTFILPWETKLIGQLPAEPAPSSSGSSPVENQPSPSEPPASVHQSRILAQLSCYAAILEDIQCRYSLARHRLTALLHQIEAPGASFGSGQPPFGAERGRRTEADARVQQAYQDCLQLQLQLNLALRAIARLQRALGLSSQPPDRPSLAQASTDKLRVLAELLLDALLGLTTPMPPPALHTALSPGLSETLFQQLCLRGTRRMQLHAGILLARVCGQQPWWGTFLGRILREFFSAEQDLVFPQDRVFLLITALGQKALCGASPEAAKTKGGGAARQSATQVFESILMLLAKLLAPLISAHQTAAKLDLSLIGWILLFLSKCLDSVPSVDDSDKASRDKEGPPSSRWDFIQGESALRSSWSKKNAVASKLYRRKLHKRLIHHKQQMLDLQQAKLNFLTSQQDKAAAPLGSLHSKEAEHFMKTQELMFKKRFKQFYSKHFKDIINIRCTDGEMLKKLPKEGAAANGDRSDASEAAVEPEFCLCIAREKCIPVIRGLMTLLLSMDYTCHVDLFIIACKVVARISTLTRPTIALSEVMTQQELEQLLVLTCDVECNHGNMAWGGAWASHAIICLLQDILEGEKLYSLPMEMAAVAAAAAEEVASCQSTETDDTIGNSTTLPTMEDDGSTTSSVPEAAAASTSNAKTGPDFDKESSLFMDILLDDEEYENLNKLQDYVVSDPPPPSAAAIKYGWSASKPSTSHWTPGSFDSLNAALSSLTPIPPPSISSENWAAGWESMNWSSLSGSVYDKKLKALKNKLTTIVSKSSHGPQGVSTAMDARLETGVELRAETRLRMMLSLEVESVHAALCAPLPPPTQAVPHPLPDDHAGLPLSSINPLQQVLPSNEMLSTCFNHLFLQLPLQRVSLDALLAAWLTLNDEPSGGQEEGFDSAHVPSIPLSEASVAGLLGALATAPSVPVRSWVLAFQTLALLCNQKCPPEGAGQERWLATSMVADPALMHVLSKFLSGTPSPGVSSQLFTQIGPTAVKAFHELLMRLQVRCAEDNDTHLKELLLKLVYSLTTERGAFQMALGPLDAQCRLLEVILEQDVDLVDVNNALSVIEAIVTLVHHHMAGQEHAQCLSSTENAVSARACFGGVLPGLALSDGSKSPPPPGECSRNQLLCHLLKLVNKLIQMPMPRGGGRTGSLLGGEPSSHAPELDSLTDLSKIGTPGVGMTSTPTVPELSRTDEQKQEQGTPTLALHKACSHQVAPQPATLSNVILGHPPIMAALLQTLSLCRSALTSSNGRLQDIFAAIDPLSVGDGVFQILCTLNQKASSLRLLLKPLHQFLACEHRGLSGGSRLSEPLLCFLLRVLDCQASIRIFLEMGGIDVVCSNLVSSNRHMINTSPSMVSSVMQYLVAPKPPPSSTIQTTSSTAAAGAAIKKAASLRGPDGDGLQNFAPLGSISSSSPTACPADLLLNASPPHRRARSAAWSYHFYPDEAWVDLTVSLPCAILLKEVHIQPHLTSLSTCPSAVSLELSCDNAVMVPACLPLVTSGLSSVKIQLLRPEVVTTVTVRLHKPRDSQTIGLSQLLLLGVTAFGDTSLVPSASEDYVSKTSIGWLQLLRHCLTHCEEVGREVAQAASQCCHLLPTCSNLLMSSTASVFASSIEAVLLRIGLHSAPMGLSLIGHLLRNAQEMGSRGAWMPLHSKLKGTANDSSVEILFQLGTHQDAASGARVHALLEWLKDSARETIQRRTGSVPETSGQPLPTPAPAHIHCIAAILWHSRDLAITYNLQELITKDLLSCLYEWSVSLAPRSLLKRALDRVLCSVCYIQPTFFSTLLHWIGIAAPVSAVTDDDKDSRHAITDEAKAESHGDLFNSLDEAHLFLLAVACQSEEALRLLLDSGFVAILCQGLYAFCTREMVHHSMCPSELFTDAFKSSSSGSASPAAEPEAGKTLPAHLVAPVLRFLAEIAREVEMKSWLAGPEGSAFWNVLLRLLCAPQAGPPLQPRKGAMSEAQRAAVETATVEFFCAVLACHPSSQQQFASVLCDVIRGNGSTLQGLSGFMRRLFLQVLLEDEKTLVQFKSSSQVMKGSDLCASVQHPRCGAGHRFRSVMMSLQTTCAEALAKISDAPAPSATRSEATASSDSKEETSAAAKKDGSQLGIEVLDQLSSMAGLSAKEKAAEKAKGILLARPLSRRGHRPSEMAGARAASSVSPAVVAPQPVLTLCHPMLGGQPLPSDMTLGQLLGLLHERGVPLGQALLQLHVRTSSPRRRTNDSTQQDSVSDDADDMDPEAAIPSEVLLQAPSLPSALQVFAGVGGLALLAGHLPIYYPEVTRQVSPVDGGKDGNVGGVGHDWVTVESAEDIYDDYEPPLPLEPSSSSLKQNLASAPPSIPPHSLVAFGLFLRLPGYAEVLLKEKRKAQCLLRLVLGVTDDGDGAHILTSPLAASLPTLPFYVLRSLFDATPLSTDDGVLLRRMTLDIGAVHLVLACLSVLSHHAPRQPIPGLHQDIIRSATQAASALAASKTPSHPPGTTVSSSTSTLDEKSQNYWAKGTGFGTGSTASSWDAEQALLRQRSEEEHVTCLLQVLASYVHPGHRVDGDAGEQLPAMLAELLGQSCLVPAISSYLRNDSVLDMARHVPLYRALLELLRGLAGCGSLVPLLLPLPEVASANSNETSSTSISCLLDKMKTCVDTYASRLKGKSSSKTKNDSDEECEGLAKLIPDIQCTAQIVDNAVTRLQQSQQTDKQMLPKQSGAGDAGGCSSRLNHSQEERYMAIMKELQFDTFEMVVEDENGAVKFTVPHHYESQVKAVGDVNNAARARRLAQEAVTLSTSLPLSASSSVFVRCDEERLDVMKVLITGPSDTPYANGCFEFDVYFPQDYPNSPPLINLETTGNQTVRFNPNLYNDGKVCLSILNTWHGRPEEKWNSQTSSFLQVLVSIQSLILVSEPYFNEPGYERSRGTPSGNASSKEYDANIRQATVKWGMLEMLRNPVSCFRDVIQRHFWLKRREVIAEIEAWVIDLEDNCGDKRVGRTITHSCLALKRHYKQLLEEFSRMKAPEGTEEEEEEEEAAADMGASEVQLEPPPPPAAEAVAEPSKSETFPPAKELEENLMQSLMGLDAPSQLTPLNPSAGYNMQSIDLTSSETSETSSEDQVTCESSEDQAMQFSPTEEVATTSSSTKTS